MIQALSLILKFISDKPLQSTSALVPEASELSAAHRQSPHIEQEPRSWEPQVSVHLRGAVSQRCSRPVC